MTKLSELDDAVDKFKRDVQAKIKANKGGDTWVKIQALADRVPPAIAPMLGQLEPLMRTREDKETKVKIATRVKTLRTQINAIKLEPVTKYIKEHGAGGARTRGVLSTAKAKADEKARVALAAEFVKQFGLMQIMVNEMGDSDVEP